MNVILTVINMQQIVDTPYLSFVAKMSLLTELMRCISFPADAEYSSYVYYS